MSAKKHVVVLMGGMSAEYEVSMRSGAQVAKHLDRERYDVTSIEITQHGEWVLMDYGDFVVHIFTARAREFYDLERLWRAGKRLDIAKLIGKSA